MTISSIPATEINENGKAARIFISLSATWLPRGCRSDDRFPETRSAGASEDQHP
jgi:hypothetical protein